MASRSQQEYVDLLVLEKGERYPYTVTSFPVITAVQELRTPNAAERREASLTPAVGPFSGDDEASGK